MQPDELLERYFWARSMAWREVLDRLDAEAIAQIVKVLSAVKAEILDRLDSSRDAATVAWIDEVLAGAQAVTASTITTTSVAAAAASLAAHSAMLSLEGRAAAIRTVGLTREQLATWFQQTPLREGTALAGWVEKSFSNGINSALIEAIQQGGVQGKGISSITRDVLHAAIEAGFEITQREASMLTRTYVQTANVQAMEAVYTANRDIIKGLKRVETLDNKTCLACLLADGATYGMDEDRPHLPAHPGCRGVWVPVTKSWRDFGIDIDELEEVARPWVMRGPGSLASRGAKIEEYGHISGNYEKWWWSLTPAQRAKTAIGPVRQKLLESGAVTWDNMWDRKTGIPKTLVEMGYYRSGKNIYEEAKNGGRHFGMYKKVIKAPDREIRKSIASFQKRITEHLGYIENPESKIADFASKSEDYRKGVVQKWRWDIERHKAQSQVLRGVLDERGSNNGKE